MGKKEGILDSEWGLVSDPSDREKRPSIISEDDPFFAPWVT